MHMLRTAVSMLAIDDPTANDITPAASSLKAIQLMAQTATIVTTFDRLRNGKASGSGRSERWVSPTNFPLYTLNDKKPDEVMEKAFDIALILHAEHELNAFFHVCGARDGGPH